MQMHVTHVGTATLVLEVGPLVIWTDPVFGGPRHFHFGAGMQSDHLRGPHVEPSTLPRPHLVLVSHDQHGDNYDAEGRALIPSSAKVLSTPTAARRIGAHGLEDWQQDSVTVDGFTVKVTATPARHGPPLSLPIVGPVIGFVLEWEGQQNGCVYISGDTVLFAGALEVGRRFKVGTAFLHLGAAGYGPFRFTMNAEEGAQLSKTFDVKTVVPVHYEDWTHFKQPKSEIRPAFEAQGLGERLLQLTPGQRTAVTV